VTAPILSPGVRCAHNIREIRLHRDMTLKQLSTKLMLDYQYPIPIAGLCKIEQCVRKISVDDLYYIAKALSVTPEGLMGE
jgi:transcriptional regulator with XRE-family HTH domain